MPSQIQSLRKVGKDLEQNRRRASADEASLIEAANGLRHHWLKAVLFYKYRSYGDAAVFKRDPAKPDARWDSRYHARTDIGRKEDPLIGLMTRYEIDSSGRLDLILVIPGQKDEYRIHLEYYSVEILDAFPTGE